MPTNGYQTALEHATHEISEINAEITAIHLQLEKLADRKDLIEKLVEILKQVTTPSDPVETPAVSADVWLPTFSLPKIRLAKHTLPKLPHQRPLRMKRRRRRSRSLKSWRT